MDVWIAYFEDEPGFIGAFDVEEDAREFLETYTATTGRVVLLSPVTLPYRESDYIFTATLYDGPAKGN